jgi:hypothetical protein
MGLSAGILWRLCLRLATRHPTQTIRSVRLLNTRESMTSLRLWEPRKLGTRFFQHIQPAFMRILPEHNELSCSVGRRLP